MTQTTVTRRNFIKVVAAAGGGLVLGFRLPDQREFASPLTEETFEPNVYIRIGTDSSVTITYGRVEMGQGSMTALPMIVAEELEADWNAVRVVQADAHPTKYGNMTTGGSYSVRGFYDTLRRAGATGREMLITAAAQQWGVDRSTCRAENGFILQSAGKRLPFGALVDTAAQLPIPTDVPLKNPEDFKLLRKPIPRVDTPDKVAGKAVFGSDIRVPGMLYASIERAPVFGGTVKSFDASGALAVPGVFKAFDLGYGVAVVAANTWAAFQGRQALKIEWENGKWANQSSDAIRSSFVEAATKEGDVDKKEGNFSAAFSAAAKKLDVVYEAPFVPHAPMEPMNCVAHVKSDSCEIWAPTQAPQGAQEEAAKILGLPEGKVTVHVTLTGGAFGRRLRNDYVEDAVRVSKAAGAPVQVMWTRPDDMKFGFFRPYTYNVLRGGVDKSGRIAAWMHRFVGPSSKGLVAGYGVPSYDIPNLLVDTHILETGVPVGPWRSVGASQNGFVIESFVDELAHAAGADPYEFRRKHLTNAPRLKRTLEYAASKAGWGKPMPAGSGRGIACFYSYGSTCAQVAEVSVDRSGKLTVQRIVAAVDCGPYVNPDTIAAQIEGAVVMALGIAFKKEITIKNGGVVESNFDDYPLMLIGEAPPVEVHIIPSEEPIGGIGEPGIPPTAPAVANAIFAATGIRIRRLPVRPEELKRS